MEKANLCFAENSKLHGTAVIYYGARFRSNLKLFMDENTFIGTNVVILVPQLTMRKGSQINAGTIIAGKDEVILEENVVVGYGCCLLTTTDTIQGEFMNDASPETDREIRRGPIVLKKNSFIGSLSLIMPDVVIGENTVIVAQSYVGHSVPDNMIRIPLREFRNISRAEYTSKNR